MYYNIDIITRRFYDKEGNLPIDDKVRKVSKVTEEKLKYYIDLYLTDENEIIITKYQQ